MDVIKQNLKDARDAIDKEQFEEAIKLLKNVLRTDKNNYIALILLGKALQNSEHASFAFKRAISLNEDKPLAWQGLANYYEKNHTFENGVELAKIYRKFLGWEDDLNKFEAICVKFKSNALISDRFQSCVVLYDFAEKLDKGPKRKLCFETMKTILNNVEFKSDEAYVLLFENVFIEDAMADETFLIKYFSFLLFCKGFEEMFGKCKEFILKHDYVPLKNWLLQSFISYFVTDNSFQCDVNLAKDVQGLIEKQISVDDQIYVKAIVAFIEKEYYTCYQLSNYLEINKTGDHLSIFHGHNCLKLQRWFEAENMAKKILNKSDSELKRKAVGLLLIALANRVDTCLDAIKLIDEYNVTELSSDEQLALFSAYLHANNTIEAEKCLSNLTLVPEYYCLEAMLLKKIGESDEALRILTEHKDSSTMCLFELAVCNWERKQYDNLLPCLLNVAKVDKYNYQIFMYLGDYYMTVDENIEKANKCFIKAFTLNPECSRAGKRVSHTYRILENWEANFKFLNDLSNANKNIRDSWVYLELGLQHLALEQFDESVLNLRTYIRLNPEDIDAWESLADAYYSRGSYSSASKCYQKVVDMDGTRSYALVQIGTVHCLLGEYADALASYNKIEEKDYLPAMKGIADVYSAKAIEKLNANIFGGARDCTQDAITLLSKAILQGYEFICLWNNLSNDMAFIGRLPPKYRWFNIDGRFCGENYPEGLTVVRNKDVFDLSIKCFYKAIKISGNETHLYYELSSVYLDYYKTYRVVSAVQKAYLYLKKCLSIDKTNWEYWNLFGNVCMTKDIKKYAFAQHAFIKAINLEYNNAIAWSNLGFLYLKFDEKGMANKAFQIAQQVDPSFLNSWIGQALIAESVNDPEAMDLFRHSCQLGFHKESALGYAEWVCKTLMNQDDKSEKTEYSIHKMHAVPTACDLMTWLIEYEESDPCCFNILGVLQEKMGLVRTASETYKKALLLDMEPKHKDIVLVNYGRSMYRLQDYESALSIFKSVSEACLNSALGLALTYYKLRNYEEAYNIYGKALQWLSNDDREKAQLLVAMSNMIYKFQPSNIDECKTLLFQSIKYNKDSVCIPGLLAVYALGWLNSDQALSQVVINEFNKLKNKFEYVHYIGFFESLFLIKKNQHVEAIRKISSYIHMFPDNAYLWKHLALYCSSNMLNKPYIASRSAQKAIAFEKLGDDYIECYRIASIAEMFMGNVKQSKIFALKAIHLHPNSAENWSILVFILAHSNQPICKNLNPKRLARFIRNSLNPSKAIVNWLNSSERHFINLTINNTTTAM